MDYPDFPSTQPVIIGALGGSGTRAGVGLLREAGIWMGDQVNPETEDSKAMRAYLNGWFNPILEAVTKGYGINEDAVRDLHRALSIHRENIPGADAPWGWKNPRNMWLIPFYAQVFPGFKFIHMIRDVRELATSNNDYLLRTSGRLLLADNPTDDPRLAQIRIWTLGNKLARHFATSILGETNYFVIQYEELCAEPRPVIERLFAFLGAELDDERLANCLSLIHPSPRLGNWLDDDPFGGVKVDSETLNVMESFGYPV